MSVTFPLQVPTLPALPPFKEEKPRGTWWREVLEAHKVIPDVVVAPLREIYFLDEKETVKDALELFREKNIHSAPIYSEKLNRFIGLIDLLDITKYIISTLDLPTMDSPGWVEPIGEDILNRSIDVLKNISERNPLITVEETVPVGDLLQVFADTQAHRVALLSKSNRAKIVTLVSARDIINWLHSKIFPRLPPEVAQRLPKVWDIATKNVVKLPDTKRAFEAFHVLHDSKLSAIPIVDKDGNLVTTVSASDIKGIIGLLEPGKNLISSLRLPITEYMVLARSVNEEIRQRSLSRVWTCQPDDTLLTAVEKLTVAGVHRLWVVRDSKPVGVLSLSDVLRAFASL